MSKKIVNMMAVIALAVLAVSCAGTTNSATLIGNPSDSETAEPVETAKAKMISHLTENPEWWGNAAGDSKYELVTFEFFTGDFTVQISCFGSVGDAVPAVSDVVDFEIDDDGIVRIDYEKEEIRAEIALVDDELVVNMEIEDTPLSLERWQDGMTSGKLAAGRMQKLGKVDADESESSEESSVEDDDVTEVGSYESTFATPEFVVRGMPERGRDEELSVKDPDNYVGTVTYFDRGVRRSDAPTSPRLLSKKACSGRADALACPTLGVSIGR